MKTDLLRPLVAEALGTLLLVASIVGSGIMAARLTNDMALALLCNAIATGAILFVLIEIFGPVSGAHFNPAVTLAFALRKSISVPRALLYGTAQLLGGIGGTFLAHAMFGLSVLAVGLTVRTGPAQWLAEAVATTGLLLTIFGCASRPQTITAAAVGLYITAAYWFTASMSFANPAVTLARALTPSFSGIRPEDAIFFALAQFAAAIILTPFIGWIFRR